MAIVSTKNNDVSHITLATLNKPMGTLDLRIVGGLLDTSLEVDTPMGLEMVSINTNDYGSRT